MDVVDVCPVVSATQARGVAAPDQASEEAEAPPPSWRDAGEGRVLPRHAHATASQNEPEEAQLTGRVAQGAKGADAVAEEHGRHQRNSSM